MKKTDQMSFFDAPVDSPSDPEAMAQTLAQHPDFRVLRRLVQAGNGGRWRSGWCKQAVPFLEYKTRNGPFACGGDLR